MGLRHSTGLEIGKDFSSGHQTTKTIGYSPQDVRKTEKDLLQARIKTINSILDNVGKQTELFRSQLVSILSTQRLRECQDFIEKVGEIRFNKVKQRHLKTSLTTC